MLTGFPVCPASPGSPAGPDGPGAPRSPYIHIHTYTHRIIVTITKNISMLAIIGMWQ